MPPSPIKVLVAHCDPLVSVGLQTLLRRHSAFAGAVCQPAPIVRSQFRGLPPSDMIVADYQTGLRLLQHPVAERYPIVILTHEDGDALMFHALRAGVRGYLLLNSPLNDLIEGLRTVYGGGTALSPVVAFRIAGWTVHQSLTTREVDVLRHMMAGLSNKRIADELTVAAGTVKSHVKAILRKLQAKNRTEAVLVAQRSGIAWPSAESHLQLNAVEVTGHARETYPPVLKHSRKASGT